MTDPTSSNQAKGSAATDNEIGPDEAAAYLSIVDSTEKGTETKRHRWVGWLIATAFGLYTGTLVYGSFGIALAVFLLALLILGIYLTTRPRGKRKNPRQDPFTEELGQPGNYWPFIIFTVTYLIALVLPEHSPTASIIVGVLTFLGFGLAADYYKWV